MRVGKAVAGAFACGGMAGAGGVKPVGNSLGAQAGGSGKKNCAPREGCEVLDCGSGVPGL